MVDPATLEIPIEGMDCADCTRHVRQAILDINGVDSVEVFLGAEKAVIHLDQSQVNLPMIKNAVIEAGYSVPDTTDGNELTSDFTKYSRQILALLGLIFGFVLFVVVVGEWLGFSEIVVTQVPWYIGIGIVFLIGYPVFIKVFKAAIRGQVIAHTLMVLGVLAALLIGQWLTAALISFFMRVGDYTERFTTERARDALKSLVDLAPRIARVIRGGGELEIPIEQVVVGDVAVIRPGEIIPVDGDVVDGHAVIDQSTITGESRLLEAGPGSKVYAATLAHEGSLRVSVSRVGADTTIGKIITQVEQAEAHRADLQRIADRFSTYFLPFVLVVAVVTFIMSRDPSATAAVLVVACSCAIALATPIAMLASIGAGAKRGLMFKGGKYLEALAQADILLIDKTGTITFGEPEVTSIVATGREYSSLNEDDPKIRVRRNWILQAAASAEKYSEHPMAKAIREKAEIEGLDFFDPVEFKALPGKGVTALVNGHQVVVGNRHLFSGKSEINDIDFSALESEGNTLSIVEVDGRVIGILAAADKLRPEVPEAITEISDLGIQQVEILTGDNTRVAEKLADQLGVAYQAELLPEDKIRIVKDYQLKGYSVIMVGDGVNDAPALAQADVGIAMAAAGRNAAVEASHIAIMHDDWLLIPEAIRISRRTMRVVKGNIGFTAGYNVIGLSLAAFGILPPVLAAAAQSIPDLGILANSSRLLKQK